MRFGKRWATGTAQASYQHRLVIPISGFHWIAGPHCVTRNLIVLVRVSVPFHPLHQELAERRLFLEAQ